ncbi:MAG: 50S ribosome-binding GTPase [Candidatus Poseidoniaceae archaeon]|nr:50S ribosome-binding GTPase [Candidatus Poseidoniaceae archaeon]
MRIGLVGKPNVGKSTFFSAATLAKVDIANYPFCTIDPNVGVAFIAAPQECPCKTLRERLESEGRLEPILSTDTRKGSICEPRTGSCIGHVRLVPTFLVDVAGLVPGASEGKGRGNAFLADLANCDALIQVVDAAGLTDIEGNPIAASEDIESSLGEEITFLTKELDSWIYGILNEGWSRGSRRVQAEGEKGLSTFLHERFTGLGANLSHVLQAIDGFRNQWGDIDTPWMWEEGKVRSLAFYLRQQLFPIHIAANKADSAKGEPWNKITSNGIIQPTMADMELALRRADSGGMISYSPGNHTFTIADESKLNPAQINALSTMKEKLAESKGTGVAKLLSRVLFDALDHVVVFPVADENAWKDGDGRILPDAFVVPNGIEAKALAYKVHSDLGDGFIKAVDGRTRRIVGSEHECGDNDVIKIHAKS